MSKQKLVLEIFTDALFTTGRKQETSNRKQREG